MVPALGAAVVLAACGGGGGSGGKFDAPYHITLRADKTQLPVNVNNQPVGRGVSAPFSTPVYINVSTGGRPAPSGTPVSCHLDSGMDNSAVIYKQDDFEEGFRNIGLETNSGGEVFILHAGDKAGTVRIICAVADPRDGREYSASLDVVVGGAGATGKPSHMRVVWEDSVNKYLGTQGNVARVPTAQVMQVQVLDDLNQPVVGSGNQRNVQVRIVPMTDAAIGARLVAGNASSYANSGTVLQLSTIQNVASFSVISGSQTGPILLEYTADRHDNDVTNGIQDPITVIDRVDVVQRVTEPVAIAESGDFINVTNTVPFSYLLTAEDGLPPYYWEATGLPKGLSLNASLGVIEGTPNDRAGDYLVWLTVWDQNEKKATGFIRMKVHDAMKPEDFSISGCTHLADAEQTCHIATAVTNVSFTYAFTTSARDVFWSIAGSLPPGLGFSNAGQGNTTGVISGTPTCDAVGVHRFFITASKGEDEAKTTSVTRPVAISVIRGNGC